MMNDPEFIFHMIRNMLPLKTKTPVIEFEAYIKDIPNREGDYLVIFVPLEQFKKEEGGEVDP